VKQPAPRIAPTTLTARPLGASLVRTCGNWCLCCLDPVLASTRMPWSHAGAAGCSRFRFQPVRVRIPSALLDLTSGNTQPSCRRADSWVRKRVRTFHSVRWHKCAPHASEAALTSHVVPPPRAHAERGSAGRPADSGMSLPWLFSVDSTARRCAVSKLLPPIRNVFGDKLHPGRCRAVGPHLQSPEFSKIEHKVVRRHTGRGGQEDDQPQNAMGTERVHRQYPSCEQPTSSLEDRVLISSGGSMSVVALSRRMTRDA
jgi:hypothetical protein